MFEGMAESGMAPANSMQIDALKRIFPAEFANAPIEAISQMREDQKYKDIGEYDGWGHCRLEKVRHAGPDAKQHGQFFRILPIFYHDGEDVFSSRPGYSGTCHFINSLTSVIFPVMAAAAAMAGDIRCVRAPGP
ncbi:hypothetical protein KCG44_01800 [Pacificimonas sp. WHA3]|uniref:Uncharacterized protein n=1 Tax=Pacificimonas pallii TaxID=2827236 RepID=A0ABS6SBP3_9SPHN|nr:hypothetical protein [Pacificimonas pallii]MBV7255513.1 hypothetical protein [Pacificimonas pallii]